MQKKLRTQIFENSKGKCIYCGNITSYDVGSIEHIIPKSWGGTNSVTNLAWACAGCNKFRGNKSVASVIATRQVVYASKKKSLTQRIKKLSQEKEVEKCIGLFC